MQRIAKAILGLTAWLALAYLGFWLAQALSAGVAQVAIYPLAGGYIQGWLVRPFWLSVENADLNASGGAASWLLCLPLFLEAAYLAIAAVAVPRARSTLARMGLYFGSLWIVILLAVEIVELFFDRHVELARLLRLLARNKADAAPARIAFGCAAALLVFFAGVLYARRLLSEARNVWLPREGKGWLAVLLLSLPVLLVVWGVLGVRWRWFGWFGIVILMAPVLFCALLGTIGLWRQPPARFTAQPATLGAVTAVCLAGLLYSGLWTAPRARTWQRERRMAEFSSAHYDIRYDPAHFTRQFIQAFAAQRENILAREAARLSLPEHSASLRLVLYGDFSAERHATSSREPYDVDGTTIRAVLADHVEELDPAADASALLDAAWGRPASPVLGEWVARWVAGEWRGRDVEAWAAQIEGELDHHTLGDLLSPVGSDGEISPLARAPLGGAWLGWVYQKFGLEGVRKVYSTRASDSLLVAVSKELGIAPPELEHAWNGWAAVLQTKYPPLSIQTRLPDANGFFRGISFSQEGWGESPGALVSTQAAEQLRDIRGLDANAVALVPYGFVRGTGDAVSYIGTGETDEDISQAGWVAHQLGMKVMLKPQLWVGGGEFTGQIHFDQPGDRARWLRSYREFILHYARLAELEKFELFCVGNELEGVTYDEAAWRQIIRDVRRVYHGPLTYAANWGKEFFAVRFWDALDCAGLNNYYPLASAPSSNAGDLKPGAEALAAKLAAFSEERHKPIIFTEVGYPSVHGAAVEPWIHDAARGTSNAEQAACYEAIFRAFVGRPWFRGMFWWKWPSSGRGGGLADGSYTPMGKPAADVIRNWYTRMAGEAAPVPADSR